MFIYEGNLNKWEESLPDSCSCSDIMNTVFRCLHINWNIYPNMTIHGIFILVNVSTLQPVPMKCVEYAECMSAEL